MTDGKRKSMSGDEISPDVKEKIRRIKRIPYRVDVNTTVYIEAKYSKKERQARFERFCIKHRLGDWRTFVERQNAKAV
jgi:hypothetical protein